jgi:hypothetical protein
VAAGAHIPSKRTLLQPEIVLVESITSRSKCMRLGRKSVKIYGTCG